MKNTNPKRLAFQVSSFILLIYILVYIILSLVLLEILFWPMLISGLIMFAATYVVFSYTLEKFIYDKIKVIYKTIHNLKVPKKEKEKSEGPKADMIAQVHKEVIEWEKDKKEEIAKLKELEKYRREFLGNISHELKTPIFNIQGYVLTLLDGGLEDPAINKNFLLRTEKSINRMIAIVEDLEAISNLESGELQMDSKKFDIVGLTKEVIEFLDIKMKKKKNKVHLAQSYDKPINVFADKRRIRQVLINLIDNAIKYNDKEKGETKISFFDMDENVLVEVTDNGVGISQQDVTRVFERFYRTDKARSRVQGGTGLGLSIVKHIIEAHNQTIHVRSTLGVGTTFAFTLKKS